MAKSEKEQTYVLKENYYPHLVLALPKSQHILMSYIGKYRDNNGRVLNSPYPSQQLIFNTRGEDVNILYRCSNIDKEEMDNVVKQINIEEYDKEKKSFNSINVLFVMLIRYYWQKNDMDRMRNVLMYFAYSIYGLRWHVSFKPYGANHAVMEYTVNNMSDKFKLRTCGSIDKWLDYTLNKSLPTYKEQFERFSDKDIDDIISAFITRISNGIKNIRDKYETAYRNKKAILESKEFIDGTNTLLEQASFTSEVETLSLEFTNEFFSVRPSSKRIYNAAKLANISINELQITMDMVFDAADVKEVREFFNCLFTIYYTTIEYTDIRDVSVKNIKFMQYMDSIFRKGNTKDVNILRAKEIMDGWLLRGSKTFRKTKRTPTIADFRRGVYLYMILLVCGMG